MTIEGYQVVCYGSRNNHVNNKRMLKHVCQGCPLYMRGGLNTMKPTWRFNNLVGLYKRNCKLKELYGKQH